MAGAEQAERDGAQAERESRAPERMPEARPAREVFPRIVTVSREFAAGGARIAGRVAATLGFQLWDHELIVHVARKADVELPAISEIDERERDLLHDVISTSLHGARVSGSAYRSLVTRTVAELAERGAAVIVGRGAHALVTAEQALRVRVVCPFKLRVDRHARREHLDWGEAERFVRAKDRERARFARQLCGENTDDPTHFDVVLNTAELSEEAAAKLVIAVYHARFGVTTTSVRGERRDATAP